MSMIKFEFEVNIKCNQCGRDLMTFRIKDLEDDLIVVEPYEFCLKAAREEEAEAALERQEWND